MVDKTRSTESVRFLRNGYSTYKFWSNLKLLTWLKKLHHGCFPCVLKILEQLIFEHLQVDDSALEEKTPNKDSFI